MVGSRSGQDQETGPKARDGRAAALSASGIRSQRIRAQNDHAAREHGYADIEDLLGRTRELSDRQLAERFWFTRDQARKLRARYGVRSMSRTTQTELRRRALDVPPEVTLGEQPLSDDGLRLQCLECGRWYRALTKHIPMAHRPVTVMEYRARHGLAATVFLDAADVRQGQSQRFKRRLATEPGLRDAQRRNAEALGRHRAKAVEGSRAAMQRPEVRQRLQESMAKASAARSRRIRRRHDASARKHGYKDLPDLLGRTSELPAREVAPLLGVSRGSIVRIRKEHGVASGGRRRREPSAQEVEQRRRREAERGRRIREEANALTRTPVTAPPGVQPETDDKLQCLECGSWFASLGAHLSRKHELAAEDYRAAHELTVTQSLVSPRLRETFAERERRRWAADPARWADFPGDADRMAAMKPLAAASIAENKQRAGYQLIGRELTWHASQVRSQRIRAAYDASAQAAGYPDIVALLKANTHLTARKLAEMTELTERQVGDLRRRYGIYSIYRRRGRSPA